MDFRTNRIGDLFPVRAVTLILGAVYTFGFLAGAFAFWLVH